MDRPLAGIRVLDLGQIYLGGYTGMLLAYLGADVVKIEPPWGENVRTRTDDRVPPQYQYLNANKRGLTLDLKADEGRDVFLELVEVADVVIENFATGTMADLGLGYETLSEVNPALVYGHGSGYGDTGPYADYPAMDLTIQAMSGVMETTGYPDQPPTKAGPAFADFMGACHLVCGVTSALLQRERTGEGQYVDVGMFDTILPTLASPVAAWVGETGAPPRTGNKHSGLSIAPYDAYEVDDGYVTIICIAERQWEALARLVGAEELLDDERFATKVARAAHADEIDAHLEPWLEGRPKDEVVERLLDAGVPCAPVQTVEEVIDDPHLRARDMIAWLENRSSGRDEMPVPGMPVKFSGSAAPEIEPAPDLGEHVDEVLAEYLGYDADRVAALREDGAL